MTTAPDLRRTFRDESATAELDVSHIIDLTEGERDTLELPAETQRWAAVMAYWPEEVG